MEFTPLSECSDMLSIGMDVMEVEDQASVARDMDAKDLAAPE